MSTLKRLIKWLKFDFRDGIIYIKKINWTSWIILTILTFAFTISIQNIAQHFSKGYLSGNELATFLEEQLYDKLNTGKENLKMELISSGKVENLKKDTIITCGMYRSKINFNEINYTGRFIALYEKKQKGLLNYILNTEPNYKISYLLQYETRDIDDYFFYNPELIVDDIDSDGQNEFLLSFTTNFADRISNSLLIFKQKNGVWDIINPDLSSISEEVKKLDSTIIDIFIDKFEFNNNGNIEEIYSLSKGGCYLKGENPLSNKPSICVCIALLKENECIADIHDFASIMYVFDAGVIKRSIAWNEGKPDLSNLDDSEIFDVDRWGYETSGGMVFYNLD
ncbi:MAG: hypothetical protein PHX08_25660 [Lachnospiraceae bacterium]|nr:hypothetical protein [Lachnospiraceae bacterium]